MSAYYDPSQSASLLAFAAAAACFFAAGWLIRVHDRR
jgi:hypothetical protein